MNLLTTGGTPVKVALLSAVILVALATLAFVWMRDRSGTPPESGSPRQMRPGARGSHRGKVP